MNVDKLRDYQVAPTLAMHSAFERWGSALNSSETGTGKTYSTCALIKHYDAPTVVVAPRPLEESWKRAGAYMGVEFDFINYEMIRTGRTPYGRLEVVQRRRSGKVVKRFVWSPEVKMVVFDEAHRCKAWQGGLNAAVMIGARRQGIPGIALTATPATTPFDLKALGFFLGLHDGSGYWRWLKKHGCEKDWTGRLEFGSSDEDRAAHMTRLREEMFPEHGVRVRKADIPGFPTTQILPELYHIANPGLVDSLYAEMERELKALHKRKLDDKSPDAPVTSILRAREQVELMKVPVLLELLWDAHEQGRSVVIFVNFRSTVEALSNRMQTIPHGTLIGGMPKRTLQRTIDAFQADDFRALVAVSQVGGVGIGVHDVRGVYPRETLICPGWSALDFEQLIGRACRDGGRSHTIQRVVLAAGTVEEHVFGTLSGKLSTQSALTDEDFIPFHLKHPISSVEIELKKKLDAEDSSVVDDQPSMAEVDLSVQQNPEYTDDEIPF